MKKSLIAFIIMTFPTAMYGTLGEALRDVVSTPVRVTEELFDVEPRHVIVREKLSADREEEAVITKGHEIYIIKPAPPGVRQQEDFVAFLPTQLNFLCGLNTPDKGKISAQRCAVFKGMSIQTGILED